MFRGSYIQLSILKYLTIKKIFILQKHEVEAGQKLPGYFIIWGIGLPWTNWNEINSFRIGVPMFTAKSKSPLCVTKLDGWKPLTFVCKSSILDFAAVLDTP